jgi:MFS family permease
LLILVFIGIGFGLIYLPAIVSVGFYFERRRSFAMGIAVCGSGLGTLAFPAIMPYIINHPSWLDYDGALLVEAAVIFICIIFGVLMVRLH